MAQPSPSWRVKTRPCPFYQHGRCLFADSCNFQHSVSAKISSMPTSRPQMPSAADSTQPPLVNVTSPSSVRSPPRSPRLTGLLLALKDVIGEDPSDEYEQEDERIPIGPVVNPGNSAFMKADEGQNSLGGPAGAMLVPAQNNVDGSPRSFPLYVQPPEARPSICAAQSSLDNVHAFSLLSPVDLSHLNLASFNQSPIDSGYAETWKNPSQPRSPPRSPLRSTFGMLSSPFRTPGSRVLAPQLGVFIDRQPQTPVSDHHEYEPSLDTPQKDTPLDEEDVTEGSEEYIVVEDDRRMPIEDCSPQDDLQDQSSLIPSLSSDSQPSPSLQINEAHDKDQERGMKVAPISSWDSDEQSVTVDNGGPLPICLGKGHREVTSPPLFGAVLDDQILEEGSINSQDHVDDVTGRFTSTWDTDENSTAIFLGMPPPTPEEVRRAIERTAGTSANFLDDSVEFVDYEAVGNSSLAAPPSDNSNKTEPPSDHESIQGTMKPDDDAYRTTLNDCSSLLDHYDNTESQEESHPVAVDTSQEMTDDTYSFEAETEASPEPAADILEDDEADYTARFGNVSALRSYDGSLEDDSSTYPAVIHDSVRERGDGAGYTAGSGEPSSVDYSDDSLEEESVIALLASQGVDDTTDYTARFGNFSSINATFTSPETHSSVYANHGTSNPNHDEDEDFTAKLAYLSSPTGLINENDTLGSIYADYSELSGESTESSESLQTVSDAVPRDDVERKEPLSPPAHPTSGLLRERVFTPPPGRTRSGTIIPSTDSPTSIPSPPASFDDLSGETIPTYSSVRSAWSPDSSTSGVQEAPASKKVPFGFRGSLVLGRTGRSSLGSHHASQPSKISVHCLPSSQSDRALSPDALSPTESVTRGLRPLRLSTLLGPKLSSVPSRTANFSLNRYRNASTSFATVSSRKSLSYNPLLSSKRTSTIPEHNEHTLLSEVNSSPLSSVHMSHLANFDEPRSAPLSRPAIWQSYDDDITQTAYPRHSRRLSMLSEPSLVPEDEDNNEATSSHEYTIRRPLPVVPHTAPASRIASITRPPMYAIATPRPTLMFAIASDDVEQVRQVLESGDASPNEFVGPQSALAFTLTNDQLVHKMQIVKTLLAFGADPKVVTTVKESDIGMSGAGTERPAPPPNPLLAALDPATKYYVERADAPHTRRTSALIHRSFFRPLTRVRYEVIGQDRALEELFHVLSIHSRQLSLTPIVVLLCGPSGHGKSLLARKFGTLLDVPTHTVNMTTLNSTQDLWQSYSMSPYEAPTTCTLAEFLINNEGKRCVVVLDEIEKTPDEKTLWSLLMPWELGRCTFEAKGRPVDVRNVVWLGTSNVGHDLVFEHHEARTRPDKLMSKDEYRDLVGLLRPRASQRLGASILSRVTAVLPFVPFTSDERRAICFEALHTIAGDLVRDLSIETVANIIDGALAGYVVAEGARSLSRAVSNQLVEYM